MSHVRVVIFRTQNSYVSPFWIGLTKQRLPESEKNGGTGQCLSTAFETFCDFNLKILGSQVIGITYANETWVVSTLKNLRRSFQKLVDLLGTRLKDLGLVPLGCSWHWGDVLQDWSNGKGSEDSSKLLFTAPTLLGLTFWSLKCEKLNYLFGKVDF